MRKAIPTEGILHTVLSSERMGWKEKGLVATSLVPRPFEGGGERAWYLLHTHAPTIYPKKTWGAANDCMLFNPPPASMGTRRYHIGIASCSKPQEVGKSHYGIPGFLGVVGTCVCNTFFLLLPGLGTRLDSYTLNVHTTSSKFTVEFI